MNVFKSIWVGLIASMMVLSPSVIVGAQDGADIMNRVISRDIGSHFIADYRLTTTPESGQPRVRKFKLFSSLAGTDRLNILFFTAPSDLVNSGFLTIDYLNDSGNPDKQWLYLSAFQKSKRISSDDKSKKFMASDFSYYDMTRMNADQFTFSVIDDTGKGEHHLWQIKATPKNPDTIQQSGYEKSTYWVQDSPYVVVKAVHTLKNGDEKHYQMNSIAAKGPIWVITKATMTTFRNGKPVQSSELTVDAYEVKSKLDDALFTVKRLEEGL
jgi:hypothetical protein